MKRLLAFLTILLVLPLFPSPPSNSVEEKGGNTTLPTFGMVGGLPPELHQYRQTWTRVTNLTHSGLHWQQGVIIYMNQASALYQHNHVQQRQDLDGKPHFVAYPVGTMVLKENYHMAPGTPVQPASVTVMMKREQGYDPAMGDWYFLQFDPAGRILVEGNSRNPDVATTCAACHRSMAERDYVFATMPPLGGDR